MQMRGMDGSTREPVRINRRELSTTADTRGGPRNVGSKAEVKIRLRVDKPAENRQPCMAWDGLKRSGMQNVKKRGARRKAPRNLRDPMTEENPGLK